MYPPHLGSYYEKFESKYICSIQDYLDYNDIHLQNISITTHSKSQFS